MPSRIASLAGVLALALALALPLAARADDPAPRTVQWPGALALRVLGAETNVELIDRVVLVPDEATFLDEIAHWTPVQRWPVLIEDDLYAPLFVRGYAPAATPAWRTRCRRSAAPAGRRPASS